MNEFEIIDICMLWSLFIVYGNEPWSSVLAKAQQVIHPFELNTAVPDIIMENIFQLLISDPIQQSKRRLSQILRISRLIKQNKTEDDKIIHNMDAAMKHVMENKKNYSRWLLC